MTLTNRFPPRIAARRLALIDDQVPRTVPGLPTYDADRELLKQLLAHAGLDYDACFHGYVATGEALAADLARYAPHFILCLDRQLDKKVNGLRLLHGDWRPIDSWRGSVLLATGLVPGVKCMGIYHPSRLRLEYGLTAHTRFDLRRVAQELRTDTLEVPEDEIHVDLTLVQLLSELQQIKATKTRVAIDIEGYVDFVSCIGFATGHNSAFVVPFMRADGTSWWTEDEEVQLWEAVAAVLEDEAVPKVLQNSLYDCFVLAWSYGIVVEGVTDDTMLKHFELFCELEKSLGFQTSIYTKHPAYKHQRKSDDERVQLEYCGRDCCRTLECCDVQESMLKPKQKEHYRFNMSLLAQLLYMELRGIRYDADAAKARLEETQNAIYELQDEINREAASGRPALQTFYEALGLGSNQCQALEQTTVLVETTLRSSGGCGEITSQLISLLADAFCCAPSLRRERRTVTETTWQPMRHNGKRWVRAGKRIASFDNTICCHSSETEPEQITDAPWFKPVHKQVERLFPVAIETVEDVRRFAKASQLDLCKRACALSSKAQGNALTSAQRGELATLLGIHVKISATGRDRDEVQDDGTVERGDERDANWFLYEHCKLPKQWKKDGNRNTDQLASDEEAVIKAWIASGTTEEKRDKRALTFIALKKKLTESKALKAKCDSDGRIRCSYNLVGTETHRLSCSGSPTRTSKLNLQTVTKKHRKLYLADEGYVMCQRDLSGADGWTVAAYAAMLGDRTMLDDYRAKLKPAQIIVLMLDRGPAVNQLSRDELRPLCAPITEEADWRYFGMKRVQHGGSYKMGKRTMSDQILTDSFKKDGKPIYMEPGQCERILNNCFFVRYSGVRRWHEWMEREISTVGALTASNGFTRRFFGRKDDQATVRAALGHLPQVYTTYATTLAISRLWTDPDNRRDDGSFIVEPLHTVHDSLITQWPVAMTEWAKVKMRAWFENEIVIAQERIVIPASGTYGPSWGEQHESL